MKRLLGVLMIPIILTVMISCDNDDDEPIDPNVIFTATLTGAQEAPDPTPSTETGNATLTFNTTTKIFTITVTHTIDAPTNGHVHKGATGVAGPPVFPFTTFTSPINFTSAPLTAAQEADLNAELYYVNIHTDAYPPGEIRGQLLKQ